MGHLEKVAVLPREDLISNKRLFICVKRYDDGSTGLVNLGGTFERNIDRNDKACAEREVPEETGCTVVNLTHYGTFQGDRIDKPGSTIELRCYFGDLVGTPTPQRGDKVIGFVYLDRDFNSTYLTLSLERQPQKWKIPETMGKLLEDLVSKGLL